MQDKRIRYHQTGQFHFLTFSRYRRCPYLSTAAARELFEDALECATGSPITPHRSPKARDRWHPQPNAIPPETRPPAKT